MYTIADSIRHLKAHSTPDPDVPDSTPPVPNDVPSPVNAPVEEPRAPQPPIKAALPAAR